MPTSKTKKRKLDLSSIQLASDPKIRKVHTEEISTSSTKVTAKEVPRAPAIPLPPLLTESTPQDSVKESSDDQVNEEKENEEKKTVVCQTGLHYLLNINMRRQ